MREKNFFLLGLFLMSLVGFNQSGELKGKINNHLFNPAEKRLNSISEE